MDRDALYIFALAHVLFGKPVSTFPGHALVPRTRSSHTHCGEVDCELRVQKGHQHHMFASVPVIPKFAQWRAAMYGELRKTEHEP